MPINDARDSDRELCEIEAMVVTGEGRGPCLVLDISEEGAKIEIEPSAVLPRYFTLSLPLTPTTMHDRIVELRWRLENMAGVRFVGRSDSVRGTTKMSALHASTL